MRILLGVFGLLLVLVAIVDVLKTTLSLGTGTLNGALGRLFWRMFVQRRNRLGSQSWLLVQGGLLIMLASIVVWVLLLWTGWTLIYCSAETALVNAQTKEPATLVERIYFTGYTLFTLGLGDFQPQGDVYRLGTATAALTGLVIVTFSITYLVPVLQAAVDRRQLAQQISSLGTTPHEILARTWRREDGFAMLEQHLLALAPPIALQAQRHLTYPVLHYFHGHQRTEALAPSIAALDEALSIVEHGMDEHVHPAAFDPVRGLIGELLGSLEAPWTGSADEAPRCSALYHLRRRGVPVREDAAFEEAIGGEDERRRLLLALVEREGWSWDHVCAPVEDASSQADLDQAAGESTP